MTTPPLAGPGRVALVLSGGVALGAYQGGACEALLEAGGEPYWIVGSSTGAVNGAILAGNPPGRRAERLRAFWEAAARPDPPVPLPWGGAASMASAGWARIVGCPPIFVPSPAAILSALGGVERRPGTHDLSPLRETLGRLVDLDLLNGGGVRLTVAAVDIESGERVLFDTSRRRVEPDHLLASSAFLPDFRPIEVDGRLLGDGGLCSNLPLDVVLDGSRDADLLCVAIDLFGPRAEAPRSMMAAAERREGLLLSAQTRRTVEAYRRILDLRGRLGRLAESVPADRRGDPEIAAALAEATTSATTLLHLTLRDDRGAGQVGLFDFSVGALRERWEAGRRDMREALRALEAPPPREPGLRVLEFPARGLP